MNGGESDQLHWQAFQNFVTSVSFQDVFPYENDGLEQIESNRSIVASLKAVASKAESHVLVYFF